ncbi:MAG: hypothetical protein QOE90_408 [Thermoplasmata archaeon]|nr:hypothetical protein [Thermoplasmata archaeon]
MSVAAWVEFVNHEAENLAGLGNLPRAALRGHMRDRLAEAFPSPFVLEARCLVVGEREPHLLELVPEGITREAAALTGPLLASTGRELHPGSVVRVRFAMEDPRRRDPEVPGLAGALLDFVVDVPVEA